MASLELDPPPAALLAAVAELARAHFGASELEGQALADAVRRTSEAYRRTQGTPHALRGDRAALCARLKFFLPRDWPKIVPPLLELASVGALPAADELRVLDLGAGLGATGLAAAVLLLSRLGKRRVRIDAVDQDSGALELASELGERLARALELELELVPRTAPLAETLLGRLDPPYHLVLLGFVLNELGEGAPDAAAHRAAWLTRASELLVEDGALIALEPALRTHARALQAARDRLVAAEGPPYVFAPCLARQACPLLVRERDWCHEELPLRLPDALVPIARGAGLRVEDLTYSYLTLHRAPRSLAELDRSAELVRVVSAPLRTKGKLELGVCGAGPTHKLRRLDRHASAANRALENAGRGTVLALPGAADPAQAEVRKIPAELELRVLASCGKTQPAGP